MGTKQKNSWNAEYVGSELTMVGNVSFTYGSITSDASQNMKCMLLFVIGYSIFGTILIV